MKTKLEKRICLEKSHIFPCKYRNLSNIPHWHKEHELVVVESGSAIVLCDGNLFTLRSGMGAFLHSGTVHSISSEEDSVTVILKADGDYFDRLLGTRRPVSPLLRGDYGLLKIMDEIFSEWKQKDEYSAILADSLTTALIARILRGEETEAVSPIGGTTDERYRVLLEQISLHFADMTFEEAAESMHFSRPYFSKYFLEHTGMTFTRYLNTVRISHAVELLWEGRMTITEISKECGFNTIRNFNRVFREITGYSPNQLPKDYRPERELLDDRDSGFDPTLSSTMILEI